MFKMEKNCFKCQRELTEQEARRGGKCYYCICTDIESVAQVTNLQAQRPSPEIFGRTVTYEEDLKLSKDTAKKMSDQTPKGPRAFKGKPVKTTKKSDPLFNEEERENIRTTFGFDPEAQLNAKTQQIGDKKPLGQITLKIDEETQREYTEVTVFGASEDVTLTLCLPRDITQSLVLQPMTQGMVNFLHALISMLTFAPLHNGVMDYLLHINKTHSSEAQQGNGYPGHPKFPS